MRKSIAGMKFMVVLLGGILFQVQCRSLECYKLEGAKSTQDETDGQRSSRVHRIARYEYPTGFNDNTDQSNLIKGTEGTLEKISTEVVAEINGSKDYEQSLLQSAKKVILKDPFNDPSEKLENLDVNINEVADTIVPTEQIKPALKSVKTLKGPLAYAEEIDIYHDKHGNRNNEKLVYEDDAQSVALHEVFVDEDSGSSAMNGATRFDVMLNDLQRQVGWIRKYFNKLCRKQQAITETPSGDLFSDHSVESNQPHKISIIYDNST